jgi:ribonuclease-3
LLKFPLFLKKRTADELKLIRFVIQNFGYKPVHIQHFKQALTHKSILSEEALLQANERLEFLGDAILDAIVASYIFEKYPDADEGKLTKIKSKIVNRKTLSGIGERMGIRQHLIYNQSRSINLAGLEGNALEALVGAIYLDAGYDRTKQVIRNNVLRKYLNLAQLLEEEIDFKSALFIWCQRKKLSIEFKVLDEQFIDGKWQYEMEVQINRTAYGKGKGLSKKEAEQAASKETLALMGEI